MRLGELVEELRSARRFGLDTEFHRERTYWPRLALLQLAWVPESDGGQVSGPLRVALVDAQAVDLTPFASVLAAPEQLAGSVRPPQSLPRR